MSEPVVAIGVILSPSVVPIVKVIKYTKPLARLYLDENKSKNGLSARAEIKLPEYTWHTMTKGERKGERKRIMNIELNETNENILVIGEKVDILG